jgi:hypothetical protein
MLKAAPGGDLARSIFIGNPIPRLDLSRDRLEFEVLLK